MLGERCRARAPNFLAPSDPNKADRREGAGRKGRGRKGERGEEREGREGGTEGRREGGRNTEARKGRKREIHRGTSFPLRQQSKTTAERRGCPGRSGVAIHKSQMLHQSHRRLLCSKATLNIPKGKMVRRQYFGRVMKVHHERYGGILTS